jgi:hypothetical protein
VFPMKVLAPAGKVISPSSSSPSSWTERRVFPGSGGFAIDYCTCVGAFEGGFV